MEYSDVLKKRIRSSYVSSISYPDHINFVQGSMDYYNPNIQIHMPGFVSNKHNSILVKSSKLKSHTEPNWIGIPEYGDYTKSFKLSLDANKVTFWIFGEKIHEITNVKKDVWYDLFDVPVYKNFTHEGHGFLEIEWNDSGGEHVAEFLYIYSGFIFNVDNDGYYKWKTNENGVIEKIRNIK